MIVAATGHRPHKLGGYGAEVDGRLRALAQRVIATLHPTEVISGMALGWDMAWAEAALALGVPLLVAIPFQGQESHWPEESQKRYGGILDQARSVEIVSSGGYAAYKMQIRNEWMVNHCGVLISLWDGSEGGTGNCVAYARHKKREMKNVWPIWQALSKA